MDLTFLKLLNNSISASWLILAVILARLLLKKAPKSIHCLLWALVAVRLICPISIESNFSLLPSAETVPEIYLTLEGESLQYGAVLEVVGNSFYPQSAVPQPVGTSIDRVQVQDLYWTLIWLVGMAVLALYALISYLRLRHKVAPSVKLRENIWVCDYIDTPFILGVFRPRIYLPSTLEGRELIHVLAHERAHLKRKDHWWKPFGFALLAAYWFNPLIWVAYILLCRDIEMACDERVIRDLGEGEKKEYSAALLSCSVKRPMIAACPLAFGEVGVKERVKSVLNYKKPAFWVILLAVLVSGIVAVCFMTDPVEKNTPAVVFAELEADDIQTAQVTVWGESGAQDHILLEKEQIETLLALLREMDSGVYVQDKHIDHDLSLMMLWGEKEILLQWDGQFTVFAWDSETAQLVDDILWGVKNEELNGFFEALTEAHSGDQIVRAGRGTANMAVQIPEGWAYDVFHLEDQTMDFGICFWPESVETGGITLMYYEGQLGVCGTGLEIVPFRLSNGNTTSYYYYDGNSLWSYIFYEDLPGCYVARTEPGTETWWDQYADQAEQILSSAKLAEGFASKDYIVEVAQQAMEEDVKEAIKSFDAKQAAIAGSPIYMANYDYVNQLWRVGLYFVFDSSPRAEVYLDVYGNLLEWEDWGIMLRAEDVTASGMTLVCQQYGSVPGDQWTVTGAYQAQLMTGQPYWLEQLVDNQWVEVPTLREDTVWTMEGWLIKRNDKTRWEVDWKWLYGELEPGTYRLGKHISMSIYLDESKSQKYYVNFRIPAVIDYSVEDLLDTICASPLESSAPGAYIDAHREEFNLLLNMSEQTLGYFFGKFLRGGQTDLKGHIMAEACKEIIKEMDGDVLEGTFMTGQEWFDAYYHMVIQTRDTEGEEYPAANILRTLIIQSENGNP